MDGENLTARTSFLHGSGPEKSRKRLPDLRIQIFIGFKARQEVAFARGGQGEGRFVLQCLSLRFGFIKDDRKQLLERAVAQRKFTTALSRQENQAARLLFNQAAN